MTRNKVTERFYFGRVWENDWIPENLIEAIEFLSRKLNDIPVEMRDKATIEFEGEYESGSVECVISGVREENDHEYYERMAREARQEQARIAQERLQYEALKRKFG